jgi:hypothetical protein
MSNKVIIGVDYGTYSFDASLKQVTLSGVTTVSIEQFLLIVNLTTQDIIYSPVKAGKGGTVTGSVITLDFDTTAMNDADELQIHFALDNTTDVSPLEVTGTITATINGGEVDSNNSTVIALNNGATFTGTLTDVSSYPSVVVACLTDQDGMLYIDFSPDGTNWDSTLSFNITASVNEVHRISVTRKYFRVRVYNNSGSNQTYLRLQALLGSQQSLTSPLNGTIQDDADSLITRSVLMGQTDGGQWHYVPVTPEGHLEVALHSPRLPFGSIHTENLTPVFQTDGVYGLNSGQVTSVVSGSGAVAGVDSSFSLSSGATIYSQAVLLGRKRLRYRPGQGVVARFTAKYTTPVINSYQLAGVGHAEDGVYFGYGDTNDLTNTEFGILYVNRGVREIKTLTITTGATVSSNVTITLNGTAFTVPVTNASNIQRTVYEISTYTGYTGWDAFASGATVIFIRKSAGTTAGTQSFAAGTTGSVGSVVQTTAGVASTDLFIPQSDWNGDKLDGTGATGETLDPTKGNVFQIDIQYLGYGAIVFKVEVVPSGNNADWIVVHTINAPNTLTKTTFGNPSFPFTSAVYSAGSTTNLNVQIGSFSGFIEGQKILQGNRFSYFNSLTTVGATNLQALFTIQNKRVFNGKTNQAVINLLSVSGAVKHTQPVIYYLIKGGTLGGNPNFQDLSTISCSSWDNSATTVTYLTGDQLLWTGHLGETGELDHHFGNGSFNAEELTLQPGEWVTLAAKAVVNTPSYVTGAINTREDI